MSIRFSCPNCNVTIKAPPTAAGKRMKCPKCALVMEVPVPRGEVIEGQVNSPAEEDRNKQFDFDTQQAAPPLRQDFPITAPGAMILPAVPPGMAPPPGAPMSYGVAFVQVKQDDRSDPCGVISLIFGTMSLVCLVAGCFTLGFTYIAAIPMALVGFGLGFLGRGNLKVAGLVLNLMALVPAILLSVLFLTGAAIGLFGIAFDSKQKEDTAARKPDPVPVTRDSDRPKPPPPPKPSPSKPPPPVVKTVPDLCRDLKHKSVQVRLEAASELASRGVEAATAWPDLVLALGDQSADVRAKAAEALGAIGPSARGAFDPLLKVAADPGDTASSSALVALRKIGEPSEANIPALTAAASSKNPLLRAFALQALLQTAVPTEAMLPLLLRASEDEDSGVRQSAAWGLGRVGGQPKDRTVSVLLKLLRDQDRGVRSAAVHGLKKLDSVEVAQLPMLQEMLQAEGAEVRAYAAWAIGQLGPQAPGAAMALADALQDRDMEVRANAAAALMKLGPAAKGGVPTLVKLLKETNNDGRRQIAAVLGAIGPDAGDAAPSLVALLYDQEIGVPVAVENATDLQSFANSLSKLEVCQALVKIGKPTVGPLVRLFKDVNPNMRLGAIVILEKMGPDARDAIPALALRAKSDNSPLVRAAAASALSKVSASK